MSEADYLQAVRRLLSAHGMDWRRPAADMPTGRAFANAARGITVVVLSPHLLSEEERLQEIARLEKLLK